MTLYPGTRIEQEYAHGRDEGYAHGEEDAANGLGHASDTMDFMQAMGERNVHGRNNRAFYLGWLRGYREAVRTLRNGRWGT